MNSPGRPEPYKPIIPGPVQRSIRENLPEGVAWAVIEFINGRLAENPQRLGTPLGGRLKGYHSAHLGDYRVVYKIDDENRTVTAHRVAHRSDVYGRP